VPPRYDVPKAAPQPLRLIQELVNTADFEHSQEWLPDAEALRRWLGDRGLPGADTADDADVAATRRLREALRALLVANGGGELDPSAVPSLNELARAAGVALRFRADGETALEAAATGVRAAHGRILALVHSATTDGTFRRLKACRQCSWAFYDYSKNRSATWCSMKICGNRRKTRAYRARQAQGRSRSSANP
jgi:predicted RNA-binding Zn ribbon-like protein